MTDIIGGIEVANKDVAEGVTAEIDRCVTVIEHDEASRKKEGDRLKKTIKDTRVSLKEEIDGLAEGMKREIIGAFERKMKDFLEKFREENVNRIEIVGEGVTEVKEFFGKMDERLVKTRDEERISEAI